MNYCRFSLAWMLAGTTVLTGCLAAHGQQASAGRARKIEFSDPGGSAVASNLNLIANEKTTMQNPAEDLKQPIDVFGPGHSLQGIGAPLMHRAPSPSSVDSKRLKELLEKRHEWLFLEAEDYQSGLTAEEIFGIPQYGPNGEVKEKQSPLERYFERLGRGNAAATNRTRDDGLFGPGISPGRQNDGSSTELTGADNEAGALPEPDNPLKQLLRGNARNPLFPENDNNKPKGFSDVFGREGEWRIESPDTLRAQAVHLDQFKRILDSGTLPAWPSSSPISGLSPFDPLKSSSSKTPAFPGIPDLAPAVTFTPVRDSLSPFPTTFGTVARPIELPEVSATLPGMMPAPAAPEPARTPVSSPDFNIPRRRF